jgi:hypothetical protein
VLRLRFELDDDHDLAHRRSFLDDFGHRCAIRHVKASARSEYDRQMVKVLSAVLTDGLAAVEAACAEALAGGVHSVDVILNILSRRRDPEPAATILTPDALRLRHLPIADCARYDSLRRACL